MVWVNSPQIALSFCLGVEEYDRQPGFRPVGRLRRSHTVSVISAAVHFVPASFGSCVINSNTWAKTVRPPYDGYCSWKVWAWKRYHTPQATAYLFPCNVLAAHRDLLVTHIKTINIILSCLGLHLINGSTRTLPNGFWACMMLLITEISCRNCDISPLTGGADLTLSYES